MKTTTIAGKKVELYDSIEDLPITRFHKYNKLLLIDAGVGSDLADFDNHLEKAIRYAKTNNGTNVIKELDNMRQNVYMIQSEMSPRYMAFATLVKSIDGKPCDDVSDEGLKNIVNLLSDATKKEMTDHLDSVKKKIDDELRLYFPAMFADASVKEYYDQLRRRTILVLRTIVAGNATVEEQREIEDITGALITYYKPQTFDGVDSIEIKQDKQFERMCLVLSKELHVVPKSLTVLEYYNAFEYLKEQIKEANKKNKRK